MGRKDLTEERTAEILAAFARCIARYGLDTSLDQVAQEAGMTRSIIRHYIGNREEVVNTLVEYIAQEYLQQLRNAATGIPDEQMITVTLDYMFGNQADYDDYDKLVFSIMLTAKERYPQAKRTLVGLFETLVDMLNANLSKAYPQADPLRCRGVAYSILALSMSNDSLSWIGMAHDYRHAARTSAEALIQTLA